MEDVFTTAESIEVYLELRKALWYLHTQSEKVHTSEDYHTDRVT